MPQTKSRVHGGRAMLNPEGHHSTAAVVAEVPNSAHPNVDRYMNPCIVISDCNRSISLDFYSPGNDADSDAANLHKIDTMLGLLKDFRRGLVLEARRSS